MGKGTRLPLAKSRDITTMPDDLIHCDICGPISIHAYNSEIYFVTFTDDSMRYCWVFLLKNKSELLDKFIILDNYLITQLNITIKKVHGNNASKHEVLIGYLISKGHVWDPTPLYTPYLNPVAEIQNQHLIEPAITVLTENQLPKYLWGHTILDIIFIYNHLVHQKLGTSPHQALFGKTPDASHWRALGCRCWYLIPKEC